MEKAYFIKDCSDHFTGSAKLYKLSKPIEYDAPWGEDDPPAKKSNFVVVSATVAPFSGSETYIFPADENGEVIDWGELEGSFRGGMDHKKALRNAGYEALSGEVCDSCGTIRDDNLKKCTSCGHAF